MRLFARCARCGLIRLCDTLEGRPAVCDECKVSNVLAFGVWDAPITDDADWLGEAPLEMSCMHCRERFQAGENGAILPNEFAVHRECHLRAVQGGIGHLVDHAYYCGSDHGPDAGLGYRVSSILTWRFLVEGAQFTRADLERMRGRHNQRPLRLVEPG